MIGVSPTTTATTLWRCHTRLHTPTVAEPSTVLIVDEIASLTAYIGDRKKRTEVEQLLIAVRKVTPSRTGRCGGVAGTAPWNGFT